MAGIIDISRLKTPPEKHELETAKYFSELGYDIVFIRPGNISEVHTPDIYMDGKEWEMKCPQGKSKNTIINNLRKAVQQSHYIIIDLRRCNVPEEKGIQQLRNEFEFKKYIKILYVIKKDNSLVKLTR